jgi:hypothetical protein
VESVAAATTPEGKVPEGWLIDIDGQAGLPPFRLTGKPLMVGRVRGEDAAHLDYYVIDKPTVGRSHAVIKYRDRHFWLLEQGSVNGTFVNGQRITGEHRLRNGDRLKFHKFEFEFQHPAKLIDKAAASQVRSYQSLLVCDLGELPTREVLYKDARN